MGRGELDGEQLDHRRHVERRLGGPPATEVAGPAGKPEQLRPDRLQRASGQGHQLRDHVERLVRQPLQPRPRLRGQDRVLRGDGAEPVPQVAITTRCAPGHVTQAGPGGEPAGDQLVGEPGVRRRGDLHAEQGRPAAAGCGPDGLVEGPVLLAQQRVRGDEGLPSPCGRDGLGRHSDLGLELLVQQAALRNRAPRLLLRPDPQPQGGRGWDDRVGQSVQEDPNGLRLPGPQHGAHDRQRSDDGCGGPGQRPVGAQRQVEQGGCAVGCRDDTDGDGDGDGGCGRPCASGGADRHQSRAGSGPGHQQRDRRQRVLPTGVGGDEQTAQEQAGSGAEDPGAPRGQGQPVPPDAGQLVTRTEEGRSLVEPVQGHVQHGCGVSAHGEQRQHEAELCGGRPGQPSLHIGAHEQPGEGADRRGQRQRQQYGRQHGAVLPHRGELQEQQHGGVDDPGVQQSRHRRRSDDAQRHPAAEGEQPRASTGRDEQRGPGNHQRRGRR